MPSIAVQSARVVVSAADATGHLTVDSTAYVYPGTNGWLRRADNGATARVRILAVLGTTTLLVRRWPTKKAQNSGTNAWDNVDHDQENYGPPNYGVSDMTAWNSDCVLSIEAQTAPVDPAHTKRVVP